MLGDILRFVTLEKLPTNRVLLPRLPGCLTHVAIRLRDNQGLASVVAPAKILLDADVLESTRIKRTSAKYVRVYRNIYGDETRC